MTVAPFDFSHYYCYDEMVAFLEIMALAYPNLMTLQSIGQSYGGREIWLATLSDRATGDPLEKPGYWIDANTHAGEVTGSAVALYNIYSFLTKYGQDSQVTRLLSQYTIYVLPRLAIDGAEKYLTTPHLLRSSIRPYPYPDEQDGLYPDDINGDGLILQMRLQDDCGAWKISPEDPRLMIPREPEEFGGTYYTIFTEGQIRNFDGYQIKRAPTFEGMDFNRNYPHQWAPEGQQSGAGEFPFSEPETRAEAEFWHKSRNINGFISYHTFSAVILRPYSTHPDEHFATEDLEIYKLIGKKGTEITGYNCVSVYHDFRYHPKEVVYGAMDDYGYDHFGWYGFTIELWDAPTEAGVEKTDYIRWFRDYPADDALKILRWNDDRLEGTGFIDWQPFEHPQLGAVEIGGWNFKSVWQNAPAQYLPNLCEKQFRFAVAHALMSPKLAISALSFTRQGSDIYHLVVQIENQGFLPTYTSKKALERKAVRPIKLILDLPEGINSIGGRHEQEIEHLEGRSNKAFDRLAEGNDYRRTVEWVLKGQSSKPIHLTVCSERAGTLRQTIALDTVHFAPEISSDSISGNKIA